MAVLGMAPLSFGKEKGFRGSKLITLWKPLWRTSAAGFAVGELGRRFEDAIFDALQRGRSGNKSLSAPSTRKSMPHSHQLTYCEVNPSPPNCNDIIIQSFSQSTEREEKTIFISSNRIHYRIDGNALMLSAVVVIHSGRWKIKWNHRNRIEHLNHDDYPQITPLLFLAIHFAFRVSKYYAIKRSASLLLPSNDGNHQQPISHRVGVGSGRQQPDNDIPVQSAALLCSRRRIVIASKWFILYFWFIYYVRISRFNRKLYKNGTVCSMRGWITVYLFSLE